MAAHCLLKQFHSRFVSIENADGELEGGFQAAVSALNGLVHGCAITISVSARSRVHSSAIRRFSGSSAAKLSSKITRSGALQKCARDEDAAALAMRELPAAFAHHLQQAARHPIEKIAQSKLAAHRLRLLHVALRRRPAPSHQQIESERLRQNVILVELRCGRNLLAPALIAEHMPVKTVRRATVRNRAGACRKAAKRRWFCRRPMVLPAKCVLLGERPDCTLQRRIAFFAVPERQTIGLDNLLRRFIAFMSPREASPSSSGRAAARKRGETRFQATQAAARSANDPVRRLNAVKASKTPPSTIAVAMRELWPETTDRHQASQSRRAAIRAESPPSATFRCDQLSGKLR